MSPLDMIQEWKRGCSCASKGKPEECLECTRALIDAMEGALMDYQRVAVWLPLLLASYKKQAKLNGFSLDTAALMLESTCLPKSDKYLLQNGWSGNAPLWWKDGKAGYTTDVNKAHRFTRDEAYRQMRCRDEDKPWPETIVVLGLETSFNPEKVPQDRLKAVWDERKAEGGE